MFLSLLLISLDISISCQEMGKEMLPKDGLLSLKTVSERSTISRRINWKWTFRNVKNKNVYHFRSVYCFVFYENTLWQPKLLNWNIFFVLRRRSLSQFSEKIQKLKIIF